ncbi:MAG: hypothetical protein NTV55_01510 [Planctomycetota bacterium]|nr:hypothetical protein [Planctomycetota bacterium]
MLIFLVSMCVVSQELKQPKNINQAVPLEVTTTLLRSMDDSTAEIESLRKKLADLKSPASKEVGEDDQQYITRVNQIFKIRAIYLSKISVVIEENLMTQYRMKVYVKTYEEWLNSLKDNLQVQIVEDKKEAVDLDEQIKSINDEAIVLQNMIYENAKPEDKKDLKDDGYDRKEEYDALPNKQTLKEKLTNWKDEKGNTLDLEKQKVKWQENLADLAKALSDKTFKKDFLLTYSKETEGLAVNLPAAHQERFKSLKKAFDTAQGMSLENRGAQVAIMAFYYHKRLQCIEPEVLPGDEDNTIVQELRLKKEGAFVEKELSDFLKEKPVAKYKNVFGKANKTLDAPLKTEADNPKK